MSDFVEQCRREWRRLGVADPLADEMAADLESDLREAEADGVSAEELLGSSAFDPRSFAAAWAAERGVIPPPPGPERPRRRPVALTVFTAVAALALLVAALLLVTGNPRTSVTVSGTVRPHVPPTPLFLPPGTTRATFHASAAGPVAWMLLVLALVALGFAAWLWTSRSRSRPSGLPI